MISHRTTIEPKLASGKTLVDLNVTAKTPALKWEVMLVRGSLPEVYLASVVTYLPIEDWAALHGYEVMHIYGGTRRALPWERTNII